MRRKQHTRNIIIALATMLVILAMSAVRPAAPTTQVHAAGPQAPLRQSTTLSPASVTIDDVIPPAAVEVTYELTNNTTVQQTYTVTIPDLVGDIPGATLEIAPNPDGVFTLGASGTTTDSVNIFFRITIPSGTSVGTKNLTIRATQSVTGNITSAFLNIEIVSPTPTPTPTLSPTATVGATPTPSPICEDGAEASDPSDDRDGAQFLLVNQPERHGICRIGDIDWFKFGAVGGKKYTIDVTEMQPGLDLVIELYGPDGELLLTNDDFFRRDPVNSSDLRPRIASWLAPANGVYFIRVRDSLNIGGDDKEYVIGVFGESYGPTPVTIPSICRDLYEEDGLPEEASLLTSNELQPRRVLCPAGDADWVRFFGKAGKTYYLYTDSRPYTSPTLTNTEAGADTVLYLFDRDGTSLLDFNDDIPGSLDSEIRYTPTVDGFYYAQIKNTGDIGNQFVVYDLVLRLCPDQACGRAPVAEATPGAGTPGSDDGSTGDDGSDGSGTFDGDSTSTAEAATATAQATPGSQSFVPPVQQFADVSFDAVWERSDRPVAEQVVSRSWMWGPRSLAALIEPYAESSSGSRTVEYFDKGRMEINDPDGDRASPWFVTSGLLVNELISGRVQRGDDNFLRRSPANVPIAGDPTDTNAPTYASFASVASEAAADRTGQLVTESLNRAGQVRTSTQLEQPASRLVQYVPQTGHNIPQVFWNYLNAQGLIYEGGTYRNGTLIDWVFTLGYPVSEPYWVRVEVGGVPRDVLVQPFQRRVLTYSPDNDAAWQVEMGNVGLHYYRWRYNQDPPS